MMMWKYLLNIFLILSLAVSHTRLGMHKKMKLISFNIISSAIPVAEYQNIDLIIKYKNENKTIFKDIMDSNQISSIRRTFKFMSEFSERDSISLKFSHMSPKKYLLSIKNVKSIYLDDKFYLFDSKFVKQFLIRIVIHDYTVQSPYLLFSVYVQVQILDHDLLNNYKYNYHSILLDNIPPNSVEIIENQMHFERKGYIPVFTFTFSKYFNKQNIYTFEDDLVFKYQEWDKENGQVNNYNIHLPISTLNISKNTYTIKQKNDDKLNLTFLFHFEMKSDEGSEFLKKQKQTVDETIKSCPKKYPLKCDSHYVLAIHASYLECTCIKDECSNNGYHDGLRKVNKNFTVNNKQVQVYAPQCVCNQEYYGDKCQYQIKIVNYQVQISGNVKICRSGWTGKYCHERACIKGMCNYGKCFIRNNTRICACYMGYFGVHCEYKCTSDDHFKSCRKRRIRIDRIALALSFILFVSLLLIFSIYKCTRYVIRKFRSRISHQIDNPPPQLESLYYLGLSQSEILQLTAPHVNPNPSTDETFNDEYYLHDYE